MPSRGAPPGRNDPCWCGSGRKYKKCHFQSDQADRPSAAAAPVHEMDERLVMRMARYARERFGQGWLRAGNAFEDAERAASLLLPWAVYHYPVGGRPVVDWFLSDRGRNLAPEERSWLDAQRVAWMSVWEVLDVMPESGLTVEDLLTGEIRTVHEILGSRQLRPRDALLGRVVDHAGISVLGGIHPQPLPPLETAEVIRRVRGRLRRRGKVPIERLRGEAVERYLIARWEEAAEAMLVRWLHPPRLRNTDDEELLLTTDHFRIEPGQRAELESRLASLEDLESPALDDPDPCWCFVRSGGPVGSDEETTLIGTVWFSKADLRLETNSVERADRLRARLEAAAGGLIRHRAREHIPLPAPDPLGKQGVRRPAATDPMKSPELRAAAQEMLDRHYATWPDVPLPALGGETPRQAVKHREGRERVVALMKSFEHGAARNPHTPGPDIPRLRRELGLEE